MLTKSIDRKVLIVFSLSMLVLTSSIHIVTASEAVGVKTGDCLKYEYVFSTEIPSGTPFPEWMKADFLSVEGTMATVRMVLHISDGTEQSQTLTGDVIAGHELSGFIVPVNSAIGDSIYVEGYGDVTIAGETRRTYAGAERTVVYASLSPYESEFIYYWDKSIGILMEAPVNVSGVGGTVRAIETNIWQAHGDDGGLRVTVVPSASTVGIGELVTVNVMTRNMPPPGLWSFQLTLRYNKNILNATLAEIPSDHMLKPINASKIFIVDPGTIDQTTGTISFALTLLGDEPGKTGDGTLVTASFKGLANGNSSLEITDLILIDGNGLEVTYPILVEPGSLQVGQGPSILEDLNSDGKVDVGDLAIAGQAFASYPGHSRWNPAADINKDNKIDMKDLVRVAKNFGFSHRLLRDY